MRIPLFGLGVVSRSRYVTAKNKLNCFVERRPMGEKSQVVCYGTPGKTLFASAGDTPWRGGLAVERVNYSYGVHRGVFYQIDNAGVLTAKGMLDTDTGRVSMTHNGTVVLVVDGTYGYYYDTTTPATPIAKISDGDFISNPTTCTWMDDYFVVQNSSVGQISTSASSWDAVDIFAPSSNPDDFVAVIADHEQLLPFCDISTEFWNNTGATDFPFSPIVSAAAEWGLAARWSLVKFNDSVAFLSKNRMGQVTVSVLKGYQPEKISTPDIDYEFNSYATVADASAFSYLLGGHPMLQINFPTAGKSWLYDGSTGEWSQLKSNGITRDRAEFGWYYLNKTIVADYSNGNLYRLDETVYQENGDMIERELVSENIAMPDGERFSVDRLRVDMEVGHGLQSGQGSDPKMMLYISRDNGNTWGNEITESIGRVGEYGTRVDFRRLGATNTGAINFKLRMTDPVPFNIVSACINPRD